MIDRSAKCRRATTTTLRGRILIFQKIRSTVFAAEEETSNSGEETLLEEIVCGGRRVFCYYDEIVSLFLLYALYTLLFIPNDKSLNGNLISSSRSIHEEWIRKITFRTRSI